MFVCFDLFFCCLGGGLKWCCLNYENSNLIICQSKMRLPGTAPVCGEEWLWLRGAWVQSFCFTRIRMTEIKGASTSIYTVASEF